MDPLPAPIREYLLGFLESTYNLAFLQLDRQGRLHTWGGAVGRYGILDLAAGQPIAQRLPYLTGMLPAGGSPTWVPLIEVEPGQFFDLHIFGTPTGDCIVLLDKTAEAGRIRGMQQRALAPIARRL